MPKLSLRIVELVRVHGRITMKDAVNLTGGSRNTFKEHFRKLVEAGQLVLRGKSAGRGMI